MPDIAGYSRETLDWFRLTPERRFEESMRLWPTYLLLGGSLEPELDRQSPFYILHVAELCAADRKARVHLGRRRRVPRGR